MRTPGYHFLPDEEELILYLQKKVRGDDDGKIVPEIDIYGDKKPWELFDKDVKKDYYVFTKLKKKSKGTRRIDRTAASGTWKERQTKDKDKNNIHWTRKEFLFELEKKKTEPSHGNCGNGHWIMYEYSLPADGGKPNDYVICKIKNKYASEVDYGPDGLEGIGRFLAQIGFLDQQAVGNQDKAVNSCNKRKLHAEEEGQQQLQKKKRTSNNYSLHRSNHETNNYLAPPNDPVVTIQFAEQCQQQSEMQSSSNYNLGWGNGDSDTLLPPLVDPVATLMSTEEYLQQLEMQTTSNTSNTSNNYSLQCRNHDVNSYLAPPTDPVVTIKFAEQVQQQSEMKSSSNYNLGWGNGHSDSLLPPLVDPVATLMSTEECLQQLEMQTTSNANNGNTNFFSASPVDPIATLMGNVNFFSSPVTVTFALPVFAEEDQQQLKIQTSNSNSDNFQCGNGEGNFSVAPPMDPTATPMLSAEQPFVLGFMEQLGAILPSLWAENEQLTESTSATYYHQTFDDLPEFYFTDPQNPNT